MIQNISLLRRLFRYDYLKLKEEEKQLDQRIGELDDDSIEKRFLSHCFLDKAEILERMKMDENNVLRLEELSARIDGMPLMKVLHRKIDVDFSIVSFRKLFFENNAYAFGEILMDEDEELCELKRRFADLHFESRVQYLYADEEEGSIFYLIGVYCDPDPGECIYEHRCRVVDLGNESAEYSSAGCRVGEGVLLERSGKRILCKIDHSSLKGYISYRQSRELFPYLNDEDLLVMCEICDKDEEFPYSVYVEVKVYEDPLK